MRDLFIARKQAKLPRKHVVVLLKKDKEIKSEEIFTKSLIKCFAIKLKNAWHKLTSLFLPALVIL